MGENIHSKNTYYRFPENESFNWPWLLFLLSAKVTSYFQSLRNPSRCGLFVIDDSTIHRDRNKKADLLARTYDHVTGKYCKGFTLLALGWTDSFSFIPVLLNLLSSTQEENYCTELPIIWDVSQMWLIFFTAIITLNRSAFIKERLS